MKCSVSECERTARYKEAQLCQKHYFRKWRYGTTDTIRRGHNKPRLITPNGYVRVYAPDHPLVEPSGYVFEHRKVAYDARGGKIDLCERCQMVAITWETCHVDHDDNSRDNNASHNLILTCIGCNTMRGGAPRRLGVMLTFQGETKNALQWSRDPRVAISNTAILRRKRLGASDEDALFGPRKTHRDVVTQKRVQKFENGRRVLV